MNKRNSISPALSFRAQRGILATLKLSHGHCEQRNSNWLLRIVTGEEVIRRHRKAPKDADEQTLRPVAKKTIQAEAYEPEVADLSIRR